MSPTRCYKVVRLHIPIYTAADPVALSIALQQLYHVLPCASPKLALGIQCCHGSKLLILSPDNRRSGQSSHTGSGWCPSSATA